MRYSKYISTIAAIGDFLILNFLFVFTFIYLKEFGPATLQVNALIFYVYINLAWVISVAIFKPYKIERQSGKKYILFSYLKSVIFLLPLFLLYFQLFSFDYISRLQVKLIFPVFLFMLLTWRFSLYYMLILYRKAGYNYRNVIIVGNNETANELRDFFEQNQWVGYRFKGFITHEHSDKAEVVGTYDDLENYIAVNEINEIYLISNNIHESIFKVLTSIVSRYAVKIRIVPYVSHFSFMSVKLTNYDTIPVLTFQRGPLSFWYNRLIKRTFDIVFSLIVIVFVLSWLIPLITILNLITGDTYRPFFIQKRTGMDDKPFNLIKFRTMKNNRVAHTKQAIKGDERVTRIGKFLRRSSIDEMPQFINVFLGNMSVVGPRPHMLSHTEVYKEMVKKFMIRHTVKPGITGYAQVNGYRGEIKKPRDIKQRIKMDLYYIENWSFTLDIKIIFLTMTKVFKGDKAAY